MDDKTYVVEWIKATISQKKSEDVDRAKLNGLGERLDVQAALDALKTAHEQGGPEGARKAWEEAVCKTIPDIADIVNRPRRLFHIDELRNRPPVEWLFANHIPKGGFSVLFGASGAGKSFQALSYAAKISMDNPVVYVAGEGESGYGTRHEAWLKEFGYKKSGKLYLYSEEVPLLNTADVDAFIDEIKHLKPVLIVFDTLARCMVGGDENSAKDMGLFIHSCRRIQRALNTAVLVVHHTAKAGNTERGSGALRGACDTMMELVNDDGLIKLVCSKIKDGQPFNTEYYRLKEVELSGDRKSCVLALANQIKVENDKLTENQTLVLKWMASNVFDRGARSTDLKRATGLSEGSFFSALNSMSKRGIITKEGRFDPWVLTHFGRELATRLGVTYRPD